MEELSREFTFTEEYEILKEEAEELFAAEDDSCEPPLANCIVHRALRCLEKTKIFNLFNDKESARAEELSAEISRRHKEALDRGDSKEAKFLLSVDRYVRKSIYMEHNPEGTMHICPCCQKPMVHEHNVYCQYCGQLVK